MNRILLILVLFIFSCKSLSEQEKLYQSLAGNWLIVSPEDISTNERQKRIYRRLEDSLVVLRALKLITLSEDGNFQQMDSSEMKGKWTISPEKVVYIEKGGAGFENYSARFTDLNGGTLKLTGFINTEGESIKLIWTLKKVSGSAASDLFSRQANEWRKRPRQPESAAQMKKRLADMLIYYSDYYSLVTKEASFFVPVRVVLPFKFYQHSMGMGSFEKEGAFAKLFFNNEQAEQAYGYLSETLAILKDDFPSADNYVKEYAAFMKKMGDKITAIE